MGLLSSYNASPRTRNLTAAKRVLRYLKKAKDLKLVYTTGNLKQDHGLYGFVDSDWAKSQDRKSIRGYVFILGNAAISRSSKKQTLVALSTKEAEYTAITEASREALWLRQLLSDINNRGSQPDSEPSAADAIGTVIYADNQGNQACEHRRNNRSNETFRHIPQTRSRSPTKGNYTIHLHTAGRKHGRYLHERATSTKPSPAR